MSIFQDKGKGAGGGIFGGPTACGAVQTGAAVVGYPSSYTQGIFRGLGDAEYPQCLFASHTPYQKDRIPAKALQQELINRGATRLVADGLWGSCSESAYQRIFGEPLSKQSLQKNLGISCTHFIKKGTFSPSLCKNGTDAVLTPTQTSTQQIPGHPPVEYVNVPGSEQPTASKPGDATTVTAASTATPASKPKASARTPTSKPAEDEWIDGVPNYAVIAGGAVAVAAIAGLLLLGGKKKPAVANYAKKVRRSAR